ncbi:MAG: hypothetical protein ACUVQH_13575 [Thermogutta sp.]
MSENHDLVGNRLDLRLGFFSVSPHSDGGFIGGYLILNGVGRPLEFHCTTPVKPNRTQQILYGATLRPYLFGEQIAPALIAKAKTSVRVVCVSQWESLSLASQITEPVALVCPDPEGPAHIEEDQIRVCTQTLVASAAGTSIHTLRWEIMEQVGLPPWQIVQVGKNRLAVPTIRPEAPDEVKQLLSPWATGLDLLEPFERIQAALEEASRRG